jgi:hypothetical protein
MTLHTALALSAVLAAAYLLVSTPQRGWPGLALLGALAELALARGWLQLAVHGPTLALALGLALLVPGLAVWWRAGGKGPLTASSVLTFIGMLQTALAALTRF